MTTAHGIFDILTAIRELKAVGIDFVQTEAYAGLHSEDLCDGPRIPSTRPLSARKTPPSNRTSIVRYGHKGACLVAIMATLRVFLDIVSHVKLH